ncbi:ATP-dependent RNA helicase DBP8 [Diplonema papillatum]|nr:ATP-dependent RNA helicase DBP8 [Diplonema papillatum]KAJ9453573.1 ATP-dependent RNA helicase DBP8 [Diplonema papillatum]
MQMNGSCVSLKAGVRVQRRLIAMGTSGASAGFLIESKTGQKEPGYVPLALINTRGPKTKDTWSKWEQPTTFEQNTWKPKMLFTNFDHIRNNLIDPRFPNEQMESVPYSAWDARMGHGSHTPVGIEWTDLEERERFYYHMILSPDPEMVGLHPHICSVLRNIGISRLTRAQTEGLYYLNRGRDLMLGSHPGSGKTSAAVWHVLNKVLKEYPNAPFSTLWICPHENLARQTLRWFVTLGKLVGVPDERTFCLCIDSKDLKDNFEECMVNRPAVLIGTPNRLGDLLHTRDSPLWGIETTTLQRIVVDEADEVLPSTSDDTLGSALMYSLSVHARNKRKHIKVGDVAQQKIFLTSTLDNEGKSHLMKWFRSRQGFIIENHYGRTIEKAQGSVSKPTDKNTDDVSAQTTDFRRLEEDGRYREFALYGAMSLQKDISHVAVLAPPSTVAKRWACLAAVVKAAFETQNAEAEKLDPADRVYFRGLIVVRDGSEAKDAALELYKVGFKGKLGRLENPTALESYANGNLPLLVTTEKFARGMDLPFLTHVFIAVPIASPAAYIRMAGRVGRCGRSGACFVVYTPHEAKMLKVVESRLNINIDRHSARSFSENHFLELPLPLATLLGEGESLEHAIQENCPPSTAGSLDRGSLSLLKSFLIDDPAAVNTLLPDGRDPYELTTLDSSRNVVAADGSLKPLIDPRLWPAGASGGTLLATEEKVELEKRNSHEYYDVYAASNFHHTSNPFEQRRAPMPSGSMHPDLKVQYGVDKSLDAVVASEKTKNLNDVNFDSSSILRLRDAMSGRSLCQTPIKGSAVR